MLSVDEIEKLRAQHQDIATAVGDRQQWECVFRRPTRAEYKRFRSMMFNPATQPEAQEQLARVCVVHPSREAFDALLERYPAIPEAVAQDILKLAGISVDESLKG